MLTRFRTVGPLEVGRTFRARPLANGRTGVQRGDMLCVGKPAFHQLPLRESALPLLHGDVTVKVLLHRLVQKNKESIDKGIADAAEGIGQLPMLPAVPGLPDKLVAPARWLPRSAPGHGP